MAPAPPTGYALTVSATNGTVTKSPNQTSYASGTSVSLQATPNSGYIFTGWSGDLTGTTNPATIVMNSNKSVTANFAASTAKHDVHAHRQRHQRHGDQNAQPEQLHLGHVGVLAGDAEQRLHVHRLVGGPDRHSQSGDARDELEQVRDRQFRRLHGRHYDEEDGQHDRVQRQYVAANSSGGAVHHARSRATEKHHHLP